MPTSSEAYSAAYASGSYAAGNTTTSENKLAIQGQKQHVRTLVVTLQALTLNAGLVIRVCPLQVPNIFTNMTRSRFALAFSGAVINSMSTVMQSVHTEYIVIHTALIAFFMHKHAQTNMHSKVRTGNVLLRMQRASHSASLTPRAKHTRARSPRLQIHNAFSIKFMFHIILRETFPSLTGNYKNTHQRS